MSLIARALAGIKKVGGLVLPMFANSRDFASLGPAALWAFRLLALAVMLAILGVINFALGLHQLLEPPVNFLGHLWLPLLFLLLYVFGWLAWWLWKQFGTEREGVTFPDIERAWGESLQALERAGIRLSDTPLFLILGRPQGSEAALFDGAELPLKVRGQPDRDDAPVRVYASREAIYLTCAGASVLGMSAEVVEAAEDDAVEPEAADDESEFKTFGVEGAPGFEAEAEIIARARSAGRGPDQLLEDELRALGRFASDRGADPSGIFRAAGPAQDKAAVELQEARLRHVGRLIARDRRPYCPINGILLLIPIASTNSDHSATSVGLLCHHDLAAVRESMQVRCPVFALVCDLENLPGFGELIARLPEEERRRRMGQRFPLMPDVEPSALPAIFDSGVNWIANKQFPARVDSLWRVESDSGNGPTMAEAVRGNVQLYQLLQQIRRRLRRLGRVMTHAVMTDGKPSAMLGGCYLAGIGTDPRTEQAFVPGVFRRLTENQDFVSWTPEQLAREANDNRKVQVGYIVLASLTLLFLALVAYVLIFANSSNAS